MWNDSVVRVGLAASRLLFIECSAAGRFGTTHELEYRKYTRLAAHGYLSKWWIH